jgi:hypothetical protein
MITPQQALATLDAIGLADMPDYHALPSGKVDSILEQADKARYRKPRNANGSRGRYFYALLCRKALPVARERLAQTAILAARMRAGK